MQFTRFPRLAPVALASIYVVLFAASARPASAETVAENLGGPQTTAVSAFFGQSFTTPAGGPWQNLAINFFSDAPPVTPNAVGIAFLLTQEYLGTPAALSAAAPGFLAQSTSISGGTWLFSSGVTLQQGAQYWIYSDAIFPAGAVSGGDVLSDGQDYFASNSGSNFAPGGGVSLNFRVTGTVAGVATPEPGALMLLAGGLFSGAFLACRRRQ